MIPSMERPVTEDALLGGRVRLLQPARRYRVDVAAVLLAAAVDAAPGDRVLDLGAGVAAVGLCMAARLAGCTIVGVELQAALAELAERNAALNGMSARVRTIVHDLARPLPPDLGPFDHVVTNPPYLAAAVADPSPDASKALATVESSADLARWLAVATGAAKSAGSLLIIHRSDRLAEIVGHLARQGGIRRDRVACSARPGGPAEPTPTYDAAAHAAPSGRPLPTKRKPSCATPPRCLQSPLRQCRPCWVG